MHTLQRMHNGFFKTKRGELKTVLGALTVRSKKPTHDLTRGKSDFLACVILNNER